jgi:hypothetical protein
MTGMPKSLEELSPQHLLHEFDSFETEDDRIRQVYASYGLAAYSAQLLEAGLVNAAILEAFAAGEIATAIEAENLELDFSRKTLGAMLARLREVVEVDIEAAAVLDDGLKARNCLIHGFFCRNAERLMSTHGQRLMIQELSKTIGLLRYAEMVVDCLTRCLLKVFGIKQSDLDHEFERIKAAAMRNPT